MAEPVVVNEWIVSQGATRVLIPVGNPPVQPLPWMDRFWVEWRDEVEGRIGPLHRKLRGARHVKDLFQPLLLERRGPDQAWSTLVFPDITPQIVSFVPVEYTRTEIDRFWREVGANTRRDWKVASPGGRMLRAMLAANLALLKGAPPTPRTAQIAYNLLVKFGQFWAQRLESLVGEPSLEALESVLYGALRAWLEATGHRFSEKVDLLRDVRTQHQQRVPYLVVEPDGETPLGKLGRRVRQRTGDDGYTLELVPRAMLHLETPGTVSRNALTISLGKLLVLANDAPSTGSVLAALKAKRWEESESAGAYLGRFVSASGRAPMYAGTSLAELAQILFTWEFQRRRMGTLSVPEDRRRFVMSLADVLHRAQTAFRTGAKFIRDSSLDLDALERELAQGAPVEVVLRTQDANRAVFFKVRPAGAAAPYVAGVLHDERNQQKDPGESDPWFAVFGASMSTDRGLGFDTPLRDRTLHEAAVRFLVADKHSSEEARDFLSLVAQNHRRRHDLSQRMLSYNERELARAIEECRKFFVERDETAYDRLLAVLDAIESYPLNRATLLALRESVTETAVPASATESRPSGIPLSVNKVLLRPFTEAVATGAPRTALVEQISVDVATRLAEAAGWRVRNRGKEESFDLELLPRSGNAVKARLEVKGVYLNGRSRAEFELPETEIAVARDASVPWFLVVVAFDSDGKSETYVFDKRDWRPGDAGEDARILNFDKFVRALPAGPFPKP